MKLQFILLLLPTLILLVGCGEDSKTVDTPGFSVTTPLVTTSVLSTPVLDKPEERGTCTLTGGEIVKDGWSGKDTGSNYCNQCMCLNAGLACTKKACPSVKLPATSTQVPPTFEVLSKHPQLNCLNETMDVFIDVFGVWVISTKSAPENYVLHTANVLAEFIDNDSDGIPDDVDVLKYLVEGNYVVPVWSTSARSDFWQKTRGTYCEDNISMAASMYYDEEQWALGGIKKNGTWDTNLEEVWHVITRGWSAIYPEVFSVENPSLLTDAMDVARGGYFKKVPSKYPAEAWYKYYDESCEYECQASEYIYWALMANIGALDPELTGKCADSADEWNICTSDDLGYKDILISKLLNDMGFKLPTRIPDGIYR